MFNPPGSISSVSVTSDIGKDTYRLIRITKNIANHFMQHCRVCNHCSQEMKKALAKTEEVKI